MSTGLQDESSLSYLYNVEYAMLIRAGKVETEAIEEDQQLTDSRSTFGPGGHKVSGLRLPDWAKLSI
jgi:hypothetical protein